MFILSQKRKLFETLIHGLYIILVIGTTESFKRHDVEDRFIVVGLSVEYVKCYNDVASGQEDKDNKY